ncbi:MAG: peptidoglycan-binding protein [Solirubrobacteraceae bacterium]
MSGSDVQALQRDLTQAGFRIATSGVFGPATLGAVENFQRHYRLRPNGVVTAAVVRQLLAVDALDAATTDAAPGSGGIGLPAIARTVRVQIRTKRAVRRRVSTADPATVTDSPTAPVKQDGGSQHLGERALRAGMTGHDVRVLQSYLTIVGYQTTVDGQFGPATKASAIAWQKANNLTANGTITYQDSLTLRQAVAKAQKSTNSVSSTSTSTSTSTTPTGTATINPDGTATAPAGAPQLVQEIIAAANQIITKPYIYGGGHASFTDSGYDCSGSVSYALHGANLLSTPEDSTELESYGVAGAGQWVTIYADAGHTFMDVAGIAFDTAHYGPTNPGGTGPRWLNAAHATANLSDGGNYVVRHPAGL